MAEDFERNSKVISALKRLERAGAEQSRQGQKLLEAADLLAMTLADLLPEQEPLPRGYHVYQRPGWLATAGRDVRVKTVCRATHYVVHAAPYDNREAALAFARDIATGLLDDLAIWLEERGAESAEAAAKLQAAAEALQ